ncbi:glycoside hydrolase family 16 protein [Kitasatospora sp. NPDC001664]
MSLPRRAAMAAMLLLLPLLPATGAAAAPPVRQQSLTPQRAVPGAPVAATLTVRSTSCLTVDELGVGVRDSAQNNLDFPGSTGRIEICPDGYTLTTGTRTFDAGRYRQFGFYRIGSRYFDLDNRPLVVAAPEVRQRSLAPDQAVDGRPVAATLTVTADACTTVDELGVGVRDQDDANLDFPGTASAVTVCPQGYTLTTGERSFPAGTYTEFGWYRIGTEYHNLRSQNLTVRQLPTPPTPPVVGELVFDQTFNGPLDIGGTWNDSTTSAYRYGNHNPDDDKLDWIEPAATTTAGGRSSFTGSPGTERLENGELAWNTGLLTTESTQQGFQVRPGDYAEVKLQLPSGEGAWPALWTWKDGGSEIDSFEYHPDNPNLLELSNRIRPASSYYTDPETVYPGAWITIGVHYGTRNNDWYVNGRLVFSDQTGVPDDWSAYLILNLSIDAGSWHPAPDGPTPIVLNADHLRVWRPSGN